jgi:dihydropteroate synthase
MQPVFQRGKGSQLLAYCYYNRLFKNRRMVFMKFTITFVFLASRSCRFIKGLLYEFQEVMDGSEKAATLNLGRNLMKLDPPRVMGILNVTPDSFYSDSRCMTEEGLLSRVEQMVEERVDIVDVGACSTRPGSETVSEEEEWKRLSLALDLIRKRWPLLPVSVDTFRAAIAARSVEEYGVSMINDISGGELDGAMFKTIARLNVPYVLMHLKGIPQTMQDQPHYDDLVLEMMHYFNVRVNRLIELGVNDIILDPGFGFGKTIEHNYELLRRLSEFDVFGLPLLVGVSRKSMIYKPLKSTPEESLIGTAVLNTLALLNGAAILRVHDVKEAKECIQLVTLYKSARYADNA